MPTEGWREIWERRRLEPARGAVLAQLMAADGLDTGFGSVGEAAWREFALACAARMGLEAGDSVFEVGCGAGAFLYPLAERGIRVGGMDASPALIAAVRQCIPQGEWSVGDASAPLPRADVLAACGVFLYFPDYGYAERVVAAMAAAAERGVMILDVPDLARREETLAARRARMGEAAYNARYRGLEHLYYAQEWFRERLPGCEIVAQAVAGYENSAGRFNVFARRG